MAWFTLIVSLIGAASWLPWLIERLRRPKLRLRVLGCSVLHHGRYSWTVPFEGVPKQKNGSIILLRLSVTSLGGDFNMAPGGVDASVRFASSSHPYDATLYFSERIDELRDGRRIHHTLSQSQNLLYTPVFRENTAYEQEAVMIVETDRSDVESIQFTFRSERGYCQTARIGRDDFRYAVCFFHEKPAEPSVNGADENVQN